MAKPGVLQKLIHGKFISQKVFPSFVETWNYIVGRCQNLKGDKDVDSVNGHITVDNSDPDNPIIRFSKPYDMENVYRADSEIGGVGNSLNLTHKIIVNPDDNTESADVGSYFGIYGFKGTNHVAASEDYDVIVRDPNDGNPIVRYVALSAVGGSGTNIKGDANDTTLSSINILSSGDHKVAELYNFRDPDTDLDISCNLDAMKTNDNFKFLVRDGDRQKLRYASLSVGFPNVKGDCSMGVNPDGYSVSSFQKADTPNTIGIELYKFHNETLNDALCVDFADPTYTTGYWSGLTGISVPLKQTTDQYGNAQLLHRYHDFATTERPTLGYSNVTLNLPRYTVGDSQKTNTSRYSIESFVDGSGRDAQPQYRLYDFDDDTVRNQNIKLTSYEDYYTDGLKMLNIPLAGEVVMRRGSDTKSVQYVTPTIEIPPFTHGDGDDYVDQDLHSIESKGNYTSPDKSYYQLYKFSDNYVTTKNSMLLSDDYIDLATATKTNEGTHQVDFLVRNRENGDLEYRQINAKFDGSGISAMQGQIDELESDVDALELEVQELGGDVDGLRSDVDELSSKVDDIDDKYWPKGGNYTNCYSHGIGDGGGGEAIKLTEHGLVGNWHTEGSLSATTSLNGASLNVTGDATIGGDCDVTGTVTANQLASNTLKTSSGSTIDVLGDLNFRNNNVIRNVSNVSITSSGNLTIGNTTLSEAQLSALLDLLNASQNVLTASY